MATGTKEVFARLHLRRNLVALGADFGLFMVGLACASPSTILPAFAAHLGAPNVVIGAIPAVMSAGWLLPSLFAAGHTETLPRKLPFLLRYSLWERVPFLVLALAAFVLAERSPALALAVLLAMLLVITGAGGALMPAWMDIIGRTIPVGLRGRFLAVSNALGTLGGVAASLVTAQILAAVAAPASYGLCFLGSAVFMGLSYAALGLVREPAAAASAPAVPLRAYLARVPALLRRDRNLAWFLAARGSAVMAAMAGGFYTVYALGVLGAPAWQVGVFTSEFLGGQLVGSLVLGWLADRAGHRVVLAVGVAATLAANAVALTAPSLALFGAVFALTGVQQAAVHVSGMTILLEFAPAEEERPTYVGLGNTAVAPLAFGAPLLGGLMADALGFGAVFAVAALFGMAGLGLLGCVRDPRHERALAPEAAGDRCRSRS